MGFDHEKYPKVVRWIKTSGSGGMGRGFCRVGSRCCFGGGHRLNVVALGKGAQHLFLRAELPDLALRQIEDVRCETQHRLAVGDDDCG